MSKTFTELYKNSKNKSTSFNTIAPVTCHVKYKPEKMDLGNVTQIH